MILSEIQEINIIDSNIQQLHANLVELYEKRRAIVKPTSSENTVTRGISSLDDISIDLSEIDLSLD